MDTLEDVKVYLEYQLQANPHYIPGRGGAQELSLFWAGINNALTIVNIALQDPQAFHMAVESRVKPTV